MTAKAEDKVMLNNSASYTYKTPFKGPFVVTHSFTNYTVALQYGQK